MHVRSTAHLLRYDADHQPQRTQRLQRQAELGAALSALELRDPEPAGPDLHAELRLREPGRASRFLGERAEVFGSGDAHVSLVVNRARC